MLVERRHRRSSVALAGLAAMMASAWLATARAGDHPALLPWPTADQPAYPNSPFHGAIDGDGRIIPCRCRFQGKEFRLGEEVCLSTPTGDVLARCDLMQNNTSWIPTVTPCTLSRAPTDNGQASAAAESGSIDVLDGHHAVEHERHAIAWHPGN